jgi:hypothetical protein
MVGLLVDANVEGHMVALLSIMAGEEWIEVWRELKVEVKYLPDFGLDKDTPDDEIWALCQERDLVLLTANRNQHGPRSLEHAIRASNPSRVMPVLTLADAGRVMRDRHYRQAVSVRVMELLANIESLRGVGRLYIP